MLKFTELRLKIKQTRLERELVERVVKTFSKAVTLKGKDPKTIIYAFRIYSIDEEQFLDLLNKQLKDKEYPFVASFAADHPSDPKLKYLKICVPGLQTVSPEDTFASEYAAYRTILATSPSIVSSCKP